MSSLVYVDLLTADYTTGSSVTNSLQSEPPDEPTALTATGLLRAIEFNWTLGAFWAQNGISELWEYTSATPFASATKIWEGRANRVVIQKLDVIPRYYWVRIRTIGGQTSSAEPSGNGLPARALRNPEIIADPNFDWSADQTYWQFTNSIFGSGAATNISLSGSGGVSSGYLQLVGDSTTKYAFNKRSDEYPVITGQNVKIRFRWQRTNSISSASGADTIILLMVWAHTGGIPVAVGSTNCGSFALDRTTINAVNVSEWQESEQTFTIANAVKSSTQHPYILVMIGMLNACTGGTVLIDSLEAHLV